MSSKLKQLQAEVTKLCNQLRNCRPTNTSARVRVAAILEQLRNLIVTTYAELDSCDITDCAIKKVLEAQSNATVTFVYILSHIAAKKMQKSCIKARNREERKEHCKEGDKFEEIGWETAFERWGEKIRKSKTNLTVLFNP